MRMAPATPTSITHMKPTMTLVKQRAAAHSGGPGVGLLAYYLAKTSPFLAVEAGELLRLERREIGRTGVNLDPRQHDVELQILEVRRLFHHVLAREIVAALLQHLHQGDRKSTRLNSSHRCISYA